MLKPVDTFGKQCCPRPKLHTLFTEPRPNINRNSTVKHMDSSSNVKFCAFSEMDNTSTATTEEEIYAMLECFTSTENKGIKPNSLMLKSD